MNSRLAFVGRRVLITIPVLLTLSVFVFLLIRLVPGDPVLEVATLARVEWDRIVLSRDGEEEILEISSARSSGPRASGSRPAHWIA